MNINNVFDAAMPGQSLTQAPGASPVEHPPQFVNLDDALNFTWDRMHKPKPLSKLIAILKTGTPVEVIARMIIYQGLLKSNWNVDLGLLMMQTVIWQIEAVAKLKKIKVNTFADDTSHTNDLVTIGNLLDSKKEQNATMENTKPDTSKFKGFF